MQGRPGEKRDISLDLTEVFKKEMDVLSGKESREDAIRVFEKVVDSVSERSQQLSTESARSLAETYAVLYRLHAEQEEEAKTIGKAFLRALSNKGREEESLGVQVAREIEPLAQLMGGDYNPHSAAERQQLMELAQDLILASSHAELSEEQRQRINAMHETLAAHA